jgi:hypothetical protein
MSIGRLGGYDAFYFAMIGSSMKITMSDNREEYIYGCAETELSTSPYIFAFGGRMQSNGVLTSLLNYEIPVSTQHTCDSLLVTSTTNFFMGVVDSA